MKSYSKLRNLYGTLTKNTSTDNLTLGDELINDEHRHICSLKDFSFLHRARTLDTIASTQFIALPYDISLVESVNVVVGDTTYVPKSVHSRQEWDQLNETSYTSDFPEKYIVYDGKIGLYPTPATSGNTITINGKIRPIDLNTADITGSTITTLENGSTTLTVSAGLTAQMVGFWIRPTYSTTANTGDGQWYEIAGITNATTGTLVRAYGGISIAVGTAACTISQMPLLPETFHDTPVFKAAATYWYKEGDVKRANSYIEKVENDIKTLKSEYGSFMSNPVLQEDFNSSDDFINPNLMVSL